MGRGGPPIVVKLPGSGPGSGPGSSDPPKERTHSNSCMGRLPDADRSSTFEE